MNSEEQKLDLLHMRFLLQFFEETEPGAFLGWGKPTHNQNKKKRGEQKMEATPPRRWTAGTWEYGASLEEQNSSSSSSLIVRFELFIFQGVCNLAKIDPKIQEACGVGHVKDFD